MRPTPDDHVIECFDDLEHDIEVLVMPRIAEGYYVAWKAGELMSWGRMGGSPYPAGCDTVAINPADYQKLLVLQARFDAEESAHGRA
jgi:hypothetical protein